MDKKEFLLDDYPKTGQIEFQDYNKIDVTLPSRCTMKQDVQKHDYFKNQNILNCDKNNSSRACPILFCNLKHDKLLVDRVVKNLGDKDVFLDYRTNTKNCFNYYVGGESNKDLKKANLKDTRYFKDVNKESDLLNIVNKIGCNRNFKPTCLDTRFTTNNNINLAGVNENYLLSNVDSRVDRYPLSVKNCIKLQAKDYCPTNFEGVNPFLPLVNYQSEEIMDSIKRAEKKLLVIGPTRCDIEPCQLPWDNITKRMDPIRYSFPCEKSKTVIAEPIIEDRRGNPNLMDSSYMLNTKVTHKKGAFLNLSSEGVDRKKNCLNK